MRRGDVVLAELPRPVGSAGHEQFGTRPAIIVQDCTVGANLSTVLLVPLTSKMGATHLAGSFVLSPTKSNGLDASSVVLSHQLRAIDRNRIIHIIGRLSPDEMAAVERELRTLLRL